MSTPFDNRKLQLLTKTLPGGSFPPNLKIDMYKGNPQLFVLTGNKKGEGVTFIPARLEHKTAGLLCQIIETMADSVINAYKTGVPDANAGENIYVTIECKSGKERETLAKIVVGKQKDEQMFISVISVKDSNAPVAQFIFGTDLYHPVIIAGSDKLNSCISAMAAKEWAIRTRDYWYTYSINNPEPAEQGNGGGGNNYGNNSNNNGGGQAPGGYNTGGGADLPWES